MDVIRKCKDVWCSAASETEKFAAVQEIIKLVESSGLPRIYKKEIFEIIGFPFLTHLMQTKEVPEGCSPPAYKSVALSVFASFSVDPEVATSDQLCNMTTEFKNILYTGVTSVDGESLVTNTLDCIFNMARHDKSRKHLFENGIISCLVKMYITDAYEKNLLLQILKIMGFYLAFYSRTESKETDSTAFEFFLLKMAKETHSGNTDGELCNRRSVFDILCDPSCRLQGDEEWALELQEPLIKVLKGKVSKEQRDLAIKLASLMVDKCGIFWLWDDTKNSKVFFLILVHNVCVEVRRVLEGRTVEDILKDTFVLSACFNIFESVIAATVEDNAWHPLQTFLKQLKSSLQSAYKSIIDFLSMLSTEFHSLCDVPDLREITPTLRDVTYASIRVLCAWLFDETHVFQDELCKVVPFILSLCNQCFVSFQSSEALCSDSQVSHVDLMRFFLPSLDRLIFDDDLRAVLLEYGLVDIMFQYMVYQWSVYQKNPSLETDIILCVICKIVLTVVCMDPKIVPESEVFYNFLKLLLSIVPHFSLSYENLCLKANFAALGLLITKQYYKRIKSCETSFYRYLSFSVKFLWDSHHVEDGNDSISFVLVREYRHIWSDIMEPWFLAMHALCTLLPLMPWVADFLMESGWPQHIISSLTRVGEKSIEGSVKYTYQAFLSSLVRVSRNALQNLSDCEGLYVCKKHKLKELEALLRNK